MKSPGVGALLSWSSLDRDASSHALYQRLFAALRDAIRSGALAPEARLPSTRTLAAELRVSRNTVVVAYEMLAAEGYLDSRIGDGSYVSAQAREPTGPPRAASPSPSRRGRLLLEAAPAPDADAPRPFAVGLPALDEFPLAVWRRTVARCLRRLDRGQLGFGHPAGDVALRDALSRHLALSRGVRCDPEQLIVVSSSQQALDLTARVLLDPGDAAWVEDPGYPGARGALLGAGVEVRPVPVDAEGLDVAWGRRHHPAARLACVTPSHQFPTGVTLSRKRRAELLAWAEENDAWIVEDDYDSEFRYSGRPLDALQGMSRSARVVYVGTFSKVLFPGLRLAWLVVPRALVEVFVAARTLIDGHAAPFPQAVLAELIEQGHFASHVRRMRRLYRERRDALLEALGRCCGDRLRTGAVEAGLHATAWLHPPRDDVELARRGRPAGLELTPLSRYALREPRPRGLVLGYACAPADVLRDAVKRLARLLDEPGESPGSPTS